MQGVMLVSAVDVSCLAAYSVTECEYVECQVIQM
jgi:hypothetical protein